MSRFASFLRRPAVALLAGLGLLAACTPKLKPHVREARYYRSTQRCAQGPFEIPVTPSGSYYGEEIVLEAFAPRNLKGLFQVLVDGRVIRQGSFTGSRDVWVTGTGSTGKTMTYRGTKTLERADNAFCVAGPDAGASPAASTAGSAPSAPGGKTKGAGGAASAAKPLVPTGTARTVPLQRLTGTRAAIAKAIADEDSTRLKISLGHANGQYWHSGCNKYDVSWASWTPKTRVRFRFWSPQVNDLKGVIFRVTHKEWRPNTSASRWKSYKKKYRAKCEKDANEETTVARTPPRDRICLGHVNEKGAHDLSYRYEYEKPCRCWGDQKDEKCWGAGGIWAFQKRLRAELGGKTCEVRVKLFTFEGREHERAKKLPCSCATKPQDARCFGAAGFAAWRTAHAVRLKAEILRNRAASAEAKRRLKLKFQLPPPRRREVQPPRPSTNAAWIPGYWLRKGVSWAWVKGWWRVPQTDIDRGLPREAPRPPQAPKAETPPSKPAPHAVWASGYWQWNGSAYVWVGGAWRIPPRGKTQTWRKARWQRRGGAVIFLPGGWRIKLQ